MRALEFWKVVTVDKSGFLDRIVAVLGEHGIRYCVIGGQGVNAYTDPVVSLDLDLAVATNQLEAAERVLSAVFLVSRFPHSLKVSTPGSDLRVQFQTDPRYSDFVDRAEDGEILGMQLPVAAVEDVLQGKVWAVEDPKRRASKRQKDPVCCRRNTSPFGGRSIPVRRVALPRRVQKPSSVAAPCEPGASTPEFGKLSLRQHTNRHRAVDRSAALSARRRTRWGPGETAVIRRNRLLAAAMADPRAMVSEFHRRRL